MDISILMSTYNGEKFIKKQIESIQEQTFKKWNLYVRDDGSKDNTVKIIKQLMKQDERIHLLHSKKNLGPKDSFFELFKEIESDYYFFCDQDDIWEKNKIKRMISVAQKQDNDVPLLVYSNLHCIDETDKIVDTYVKFEKQVSLDLKEYDYFHTNNIPGCTMLVNKSLRNYFKINIDQQIENSKIIMHDWWFALIAATFGKIIHLNDNLVLYRQHMNNTLGAGTGESLLHNIKKNGLKKLFFKVKNSTEKDIMQSQEFYKIFLINNYSILDDFVYKFQNCYNMNIFDKIKFITKYPPHRINLRSKLLFELTFLLSN